MPERRIDDMPVIHLVAGYLDHPALNAQSALGIEPYGFGVYPMFQLQYPCGKCVFSVIRRNRHGGPYYERPRIHPLVHEMHRAAAYPDPILHSILLTVKAWKRRQEGRMNIHDPVP